MCGCFGIGTACRRDACSAKRLCQGQPGKLSFASGNTAGIVGGRRIISASAENRGIPASASILPRSWHWAPSCVSPTPQLKREWSPWPEFG